MKKRIAWLTLSCLMAVSLVLASCAPAPVVTEEGETVITPGEEVVAEVELEEEVEEVAEVVAEAGPEMVLNAAGKWEEKPRYGGTYTHRVTGVWMRFYQFGSYQRRHANSTIYERLLTPDFFKGPAGTGEINFDYPSYPFESLTGELAERVELVDLRTVRYYLRQGIHYHNIAPVTGGNWSLMIFLFNSGGIGTTRTEQRPRPSRQP